MHKQFKINSKNGFTIVELLVIIVVISILVTVTVVGYGNWRVRVAKSEVQTDLSSLQGSMHNAINFSSDGLYPTTLPFTASPNVLLSGGTSADRTTYCVNGSSKPNPTVKYYITPTLTSPQAGQCP